MRTGERVRRNEEERCGGTERARTNQIVLAHQLSTTRPHHTEAYKNADAVFAAIIAAAARRESAWHILYLRPPAACTIIRWQQRAVSMTFYRQLPLM